MTIKERRKNINLAKKRVTKYNKLIDKREKQALKKYLVIKRGGWNQWDELDRTGQADFQRSYWAVVAYHNALEAAGAAKVQLARALDMVKYWQDIKLS